MVTYYSVSDELKLVPFEIQWNGMKGNLYEMVKYGEWGYEMYHSPERMTYRLAIWHRKREQLANFIPASDQWRDGGAIDTFVSTTEINASRFAFDDEIYARRSMIPEPNSIRVKVELDIRNDYHGKKKAFESKSLIIDSMEVLDLFTEIQKKQEPRQAEIRKRIVNDSYDGLQLTNIMSIT